LQCPVCLQWKMFLTENIGRFLKSNACTVGIFVAWLLLKKRKIAAVMVYKALVWFGQEKLLYFRYCMTRSRWPSCRGRSSSSTGWRWCRSRTSRQSLQHRLSRTRAQTHRFRTSWGWTCCRTGCARYTGCPRRSTCLYPCHPLCPWFLCHYWDQQHPWQSLLPRQEHLQVQWKCPSWLVLLQPNRLGLTLAIRSSASS